MSDRADGAMVYERLAVRRMPGIGLPGFVVDELSSGVNVIWGPNGSGKTTLARAIEAATWPREAAARWGLGGGAASLEAVFELSGESWRVEVEGERGRWQCAGSDRDAPLLPAAATRDRYQLCLHDLLQAQTAGASFAEAIMRESAGGYDVAAAAEALGFRESAGQPRKLGQALREARKQLSEAQRKQEQLRGEERELDDLRRERERAVAARRRIDVLQRAIDCVRRRGELAEAEQDLATLPTALARMTGKEATQLADCRAQLTRKREERQQSERERAEAEAALAATGLGEEGVDEATLTELTERVAAAEQGEKAAAAARQARREAEAKRDEAAELLGHTVDAAAVGRIDGIAIEKISDVVVQVEQKRAQRQAGEAVIDWLRDEGEAAEGDAAASAEELADAGRLLQRWLRAEATAERGEEVDAVGRWAMLIGSALAGAGAVAAWTVHVAAAIAVLLGAVVAVWAWRRGRASGGSASASAAGKVGGQAEVYREEFERLTLAGPGAWEMEAVAERWEAIQRAHAEAVLREGRAAWRARTHREVEHVGRQLEELAQQRRLVLERCGLQGVADDARLSWLISVVARLQESTAAASGAQAAEAEAQQQRDAAMTAIAGRAERWTYEPPADAAEAKAIVRDLEARRRAWQKASGERDHATTRMRQLDDDLAELERRITAVFDEAGLEEADEAKLDEYCRLRERYVEAVGVRDLAKGQLASARARLGEVADAAEAEALLAQAATELDAQLQATQGEAERWEAIHERIAQIEERLRQARQGHDVERALAARDAAADALRAQREADERAVAGHVLSAFVRQEGRDRQRPAVFHEARRLLTRITRGRYRLELEEAGAGDGADAAFRAVDTTTGRGHALDELSSGTRVQLLLAVRLAFLRSQEQGVRLPLVLDETLANSDDVRTAAVIDAVLTIAEEGRQVFYLTAQADEVGKWKAELAERDVASRFIPLAELRRDATAESHGARRVSITLPKRPTVPPADGHDRASYRDALKAVGGVGRIDPRRDVGSVHLWHVVDDVATLRRLLQLGVERWGQLREMLDHGGGKLLGDEAAEKRARAIAAAVAEICRNWRIGRGRPVERAALERSGAISDRFIDEVDELCGTLNRDGERLIEALTEGTVRNFRKNSTEELRAFLEREGYVDDAAALTAEQLRTRTLAAVAEEIRQGTLSVERVEQLIGEIAEG